VVKRKEEGREEGFEANRGGPETGDRAHPAGE
jgi:hypothetical protein